MLLYRRHQDCHRMDATEDKLNRLLSLLERSVEHSELDRALGQFEKSVKCRIEAVLEVSSPPLRPR